MNRRFLLVALCLQTLACAVAPRPVPVPVTPVDLPPWHVDAVACAIKGPIPFACQQPIPGATIQMHGPGGYMSQTSDGAGYAVFTLPAHFIDSDVIISAPGFATTRSHIDVFTTHDNGQHNIIVLPTTDIDPSIIPLGELAAIRGAMWPLGTASTCGALPLGPRPGQDDNVIATDFITDYPVAQQDCIIAELKSRGYTHVVMGPLVDSDGYHGIWQPNDWRGDQFDRFLDAVQKFYNAGLKVVVFLHPDGWSYEKTVAELTPLLQQYRAQKLLRIVVPAGWEPARYEWSSCTWALFGQWARETLPNALVLLHTVADTDAPAGTDARCNDDDHVWNPAGNAGAWRRVAPYFHGWLTQSAAFEAPDARGDPNHPEKTNFDNWKDNFRCDVRYSYCNRFVNGYAGWPTTSAWRDNQPLCVYAGEYSAYWKFWHHRTEAEGVAWGDAAMAAGNNQLCGYLDSGSAPVPILRR